MAVRPVASAEVSLEHPPSHVLFDALKELPPYRCPEQSRLEEHSQYSAGGCCLLFWRRRGVNQRIRVAHPAGSLMSSLRSRGVAPPQSRFARQRYHAGDGGDLSEDSGVAELE